MSLFQRAARLAALTFTLTGLIGASGIGHANEVERASAPSSLATALNVPAVPTVPQPAATALPDPLAPPTAAAPKAHFASLADAIASQQVGNGGVDDEHLRCLAGAVYYESKGEPLNGQLAVAQVILNRTKSGRFPKDICGVVKQRGQFSFVRGGAIPPIDGSKLAYRTAMAVAKVAMAEAWEAPARDALYFNATRSGHSGAKRVAAIGNHTFYR